MDERRSIKALVLSFLVILLFVSGCSLKDKPTPQREYYQKTEIVEVKVPVIQDIEMIEPIKEPDYHIPKLTKNSTPKEVAEAYVNDIKLKDGFIQILLNALQPFIKKQD